MMTLITGFTWPPTIYFKFITKLSATSVITKCDSFFLLQSAMVCYYKVRQFFYHKVRQVLLQSATGITKCDNFITKCDDYYYKVRLYTVRSACKTHSFRYEAELWYLPFQFVWLQCELLEISYLLSVDFSVK